MISSVLRGVASDASFPLTNKSFKRSAGFGQVRQARSSRAKTKCVADAGRVNGIAIRPTEDKGARRFAAARTVPGSTDQTQQASGVPDVPLGTVALDLLGGSKGLIRNSEDLCGAHNSADLTMHAQSGKLVKPSVVLQVACAKAAGKRPRGARLLRAASVVSRESEP